MKTQAKDYYAILGITCDAVLADIKKAYRRLARKHHPDKNNGDPAAAALFREITEAYELLTDPAAREAYDRDLPACPGNQGRRHRSRTATSSAGSSACWKTSGWPSAPATPRYPPS